MVVLVRLSANGAAERARDELIEALRFRGVAADAEEPAAPACDVVVISSQWFPSEQSNVALIVTDNSVGSAAPEFPPDRLEDAADYITRLVSR